MAKNSTQVSEIAELIGWPATFKLLDIAGGQIRWIPEHTSEEHWLGAILGMEAATKLCKMYGGGCIDIPKGHAEALEHRNRQIRADRKGGTLVKDLAVRYKLTMRQVFNVLGMNEE